MKKKATKSKAKTVRRPSSAEATDSMIIKFGAVFVIVAGFLLLMYVVKFYI
ncbi:MAG: hypothetical protein RI947_1293 [Candidatus Parcubacteria bacterium]|jgi:hypothetical protein